MKRCTSAQQLPSEHWFGSIWYYARKKREEFEKRNAIEKPTYTEPAKTTFGQVVAVGIFLVVLEIVIHLKSGKTYGRK